MHPVHCVVICDVASRINVCPPLCSAQGAIKKGWFRKRPDDRTSAPDLAALLATAQEIAHGMAFLHSRSVIHGDLTACEEAPSYPPFLYTPMPLLCRVCAQLP